MVQSVLGYQTAARTLAPGARTSETLLSDLNSGGVRGHRSQQVRSSWTSTHLPRTIVVPISPPLELSAALLGSIAALGTCSGVKGSLPRVQENDRLPPASHDAPFAPP